MWNLKITCGKFTPKSENTEQVDSTDCGNPNSESRMGRPKKPCGVKLVGLDGDLAELPEVESQFCRLLAL